MFQTLHALGRKLHISILSLFALCKCFVILKELQHAQRLERLREEQRQVQDRVTQKMQFEQKYEPCVVCGDRASGKTKQFPWKDFINQTKQFHSIYIRFITLMSNDAPLLSLKLSPPKLMVVILNLGCI